MTITAILSHCVSEKKSIQKGISLARVVEGVAYSILAILSLYSLATGAKLLQPMACYVLLSYVVVSLLFDPMIRKCPPPHIREVAASDPVPLPVLKPATNEDLLVQIRKLNLNIRGLENENGTKEITIETLQRQIKELQTEGQEKPEQTYEMEVQAAQAMRANDKIAALEREINELKARHEKEIEELTENIAGLGANETAAFTLVAQDEEISRLKEEIHALTVTLQALQAPAATESTVGLD